MSCNSRATSAAFISDSWATSWSVSWPVAMKKSGTSSQPTIVT